ncbi:hypothetical protein BY458DRAFT_429033 [Sporodiniella umbellata]|nr:hypothetical protein BY458DRAFT_429033 [Sporodiniella umbellata]
MSAGTTRLRGDDEPQTSKRARYTIEEEESSQGSLSENSLNNSESEDTTPYQNYVLKVDQTDGFVEGSIVRIALTNFVTYDYCEVFPGPQMNLIIGPNGTGKSTIVCAIALGLGGSPSLLGRAKNIQEFVKTGQDEAKITIELKKANERNVVIQRSFKKSSNSTLWKVNGKKYKNCIFLFFLKKKPHLGKSIAYKEVMNIIHGFNIQVDNLW